MSKVNLFVRIVCLYAIVSTGLVFAEEPESTPVAELWCSNLLSKKPLNLITDVSSMHSSLRDYAGQLAAELKLIKNGSIKKAKFFRWPVKGYLQRRGERIVREQRAKHGDLTRPNDLPGSLAPDMHLPELDELLRFSVESLMGRIAQLELDLRPRSGNETLGFEVRGAPAIAQYLNDLQTMVDEIQTPAARIPSQFTKPEIARRFTSLAVMGWFLYAGIATGLPPYRGDLVQPVVAGICLLLGAGQSQNVVPYFWSMCTAAGRERYNRKRARALDFRYKLNIKIQKLLAAERSTQDPRLIHDATTLPIPVVVRRAWSRKMERQESIDWRQPELAAESLQILELFQAVAFLTDQIFYFDSQGGEPVLLNFVRFKEQIALGGPSGGIAQGVTPTKAAPFGLATPVGAH